MPEDSNILFCCSCILAMPCTIAIAIRFLNISHATWTAMPLLDKAVHTELARALAAREQMAAADEPPAHWALRESRPGAMLE